MYFLHGSREPLADDMSGYCVTISGLLGGHSGADVDKERGNFLVTCCYNPIDTASRYATQTAVFSMETQ